METTKIKDVADYVGKKIKINCWLYNKRSSGKIHFLQLRDGSGIIQGIVFKGSVSDKIFDKASEITQESSLTVSGEISKHPKKEEYELQVKDLEVVQMAHEDYPITNKEHGPDFLLEHRHLWLRSNKQAAIQRVRHTVSMAIYEYFDSNGFTRIDSPILTPAACEGTTELFELDYFEDTKAYLSQSGQLYLEAAMFSLGNVYDFGPVFRAEKSKTRRHLNEFWMMDAEMAFCDLEDNLQTQEGLICYIVEKVLKDCKRELELLERDISDLEKIKAPFYRVHHLEAVKKMNEMGLEAREDDDFGAEEEIEFANSFDKPVFVTHYPAKVKAFYMKRDEKETDRVLCADLLVPRVGELIGGSQREDDFDALLSRIKEHKLPRESFEWYLDLRKYGSVPHGGFGLGLERTVSWLTGVHHVRETIPFPRTLNRIYP